MRRHSEPTVADRNNWSSANAAASSASMTILKHCWLHLLYIILPQLHCILFSTVFTLCRQNRDLEWIHLLSDCWPAGVFHLDNNLVASRVFWKVRFCFPRMKLLLVSLFDLDWLQLPLNLISLCPESAFTAKGPSFVWSMLVIPGQMLARHHPLSKTSKTLDPELTYEITQQQGFYFIFSRGCSMWRFIFHLTWKVKQACL